MSKKGPLRFAMNPLVSRGLRKLKILKHKSRLDYKF
jgi:hypothetical protein